MKAWFNILSICFDCYTKALVVCRVFVFALLHGVRFKKLGQHVKIRGSRFFKVGRNVCVGDFCWIEAVHTYKSFHYSPSLIIGNRVALSDLCHISCAHRIVIGDDCLLGSKIYIGDHNHGSLNMDRLDLEMPPACRHLDDIAEVIIGDNCFICDGAVILAGTSLATGTIVGANSVVKLKTDRPALIAGVPAKIIKYLRE